MAAIYVEPPPRGKLSVSDLLRRWDGVISRHAVNQWFRRGLLRGTQYGGRNQWCCTEAEAARFELVHPRLREVVEAKAKGGAA